MSLTEFEFKIINMYATSEFLGGLKLGNFARIISDSQLKLKLLWHCQEEIRHGIMLYNFLKKFNKNIDTLRGKIESNFPNFFSNFTNDEIEFLIMVHLFELRAPFNYKILQKYIANKELSEIANLLIEDEDSHLKWIREFLQKKQIENNEKIRELFKKNIKNEKRDYERDLNIVMSLGNEGKEFVKLVNESLPKYETYLKNYIYQSFNIN
ncbi:MAG: ferritin-like domain-containing protein [Candidatus Pacearchaeota archaeon]